MKELIIILRLITMAIAQDQYLKDKKGILFERPTFGDPNANYFTD